MNRLAVIVLALLGMLLQSACAPDAEEGRSTSEPPPEWSVTRELVIGNETDPNYALVPVGNLARSPTGDIFVSQPQERRIRTFGADGEYVGSVGGPGEGPGEFSRLGPIGVLGDTLWASDETRFHFFDLDGQWIHAVPTAGIVLEPPYVRTSDKRPMPGGGVLLASSDFLPDEGWHPARLPLLPFFVTDVDREVIGSIPGPSAPAGFQLDAVPIEAPGIPPQPRKVAVRIPYAVTSLLAVAPDHSYVLRVGLPVPDSADVVTARLVRYAPTGDSLDTGELELDAVPVPESVGDSLLEVEVERIADALGGAAVARRALEREFRVPARYPGVSDVVAGEDRTTWLKIGAPGDGRWMVLDDGWNPIGTLTLPEDFRLELASAEELWGVETDELDVPRIVRYRVILPEEVR